MTEVFDHDLSGLSAGPLLDYLALLGVLNTLSRGPDKNAKVYFSGTQARLVTKLTKEEVLDYLINDYIPTPILTPWAGNCQIHKGGGKLNAILNNQSPRLGQYKEVIKAADEILRSLREEYTGKDFLKDCRVDIFRESRNCLGDDFVFWQDAVVRLITDDNGELRQVYNPIFALGGNNGRFDFSNNFIGHVTGVISKEPRDSKRELIAAIFGGEDVKVEKGSSYSHLAPIIAGSNPWLFILAVEGALLFQMKLSSLGEGEKVIASAPMIVSWPSPEIWLPIWNKPVTKKGIGRIFDKCSVGKNRGFISARYELMRAADSFSDDSNISHFYVHKFEQLDKNNKITSFVGKVTNDYKKHISLIRDFDKYIIPLFARASKDKGTPASIKRAIDDVSTCTIDMFLDNKGTVQQRTLNMLLSLGRMAESVSKPTQWVNSKGVAPFPPLSLRWLDYLPAHTTELRLAMGATSLCGEDEVSRRCEKWDKKHSYVNLRELLSPVRTSYYKGKSIVKWDYSQKTLISRQNAIADMGSLLLRLSKNSSKLGDKYLKGHLFPQEIDTTTFTSKGTDDLHLFRLLSAFSLIDFSNPFKTKDEWQNIRGYQERMSSAHISPYGITSPLHTAVLAACNPYGTEPLDPTLVSAMISGDCRIAYEACRKNARRNGFNILQIPIHGFCTKRALASLLFPISENNIARRTILICEHKSKEVEDEE